VAATVAKSAEKAAAEEGAAADHPAPPPMLEWTGEELYEWLMAMRAFRRTRTYGCLFRLKKPKAEDLGQIVWLGSLWHEGGRYRVASALLDSIPEDKSTGLTRAERWQNLMRELKPQGIDAVLGLHPAT